jgi:hypothetical protein
MSLRTAYEAELARVVDAQSAAGAPRREALERLRAFHAEIEREGLPDTSLEIEFRDEELLIDPGAVMITVRVTPEGGFRLFYEVKRPDGYNQTEVPVSSIEDLEQAIARIMVEHR